MSTSQAGEWAAGSCLCHAFFPDVASCCSEGSSIESGVISFLRRAQSGKVSGPFGNTEKQPRSFLRPVKLEKDYLVFSNTG